MSGKSRLGHFEHHVMSAVNGLRSEAYSISVTEKLLDALGPNFAVAQVHITLRRLVDKGFLDRIEEPARAVRGGRSRSRFVITGSGITALNASIAHHTRLASLTENSGLQPVEG